jgi:integrase/recombinase XerD
VISTASQWAKQHYGESVKYLFPKNAQQPYHIRTFNQKINDYIARQQIRDENGLLWHFTGKQCRHTVGTRLINNGVSQPTVQRFLGHSSPQMTDVYAHLHDQTLKQAFFQSNVSREQGPVQVLNALGECVEPAWLKQQFQAQALPNGFCVRPQENGGCQSGQACLHCTHLRTTIDYLPILQQQLQLGEQQEEQAAAQGLERLCQVNAKNNQALRKLINALINAGGING